MKWKPWPGKMTFDETKKIDIKLLQKNKSGKTALYRMLLKTADQSLIIRYKRLYTPV